MRLVKTDLVWDAVRFGSLLYNVQHCICFVPVHTLWTAMQRSAV
jgi:hypothetical protein